jgi:hypothetical protein
VVTGQLQRALHPVLDGVVCRFEPEHQQRTVLRGTGERRLPRIEQAAVRRVEAALPERPNRAGAGREIVERHGGGRLVGGPILETHPGLGDHPQDALRAEQHPVRARAGARPGQAPRLDGPGGRDGRDRLHQVVDVRIEGREVAAGPRRDPATERRELEGLREVAQREAVLAQLVLEPRARRARLDQRRAG